MFSVSLPIDVVVLKLWVTDKGDVVGFEHFDQPGEVGERPREPIDLVDDDDIDQPCLDIPEQALQSGPLQRGAGDAAIVVAIGHQHPAF